jgi:hypothetical protein
MPFPPVALLKRRETGIEMFRGKDSNADRPQHRGRTRRSAEQAPR